MIEARALATYLIPGCVGRGVRLRSESLSGGGAAGVWNLGIWRSGDLEICEFGDLVTWKSRNLGSKKSQKYKFSEFKSVLPKTSARSGLVGENPPGPIWGHLRQFFPWTGKIQKMPKFCLFPLVGQWALFTRCGPLLLST